MPADTYGYSATEITWEVEETDVRQSGTDFVEIACSGVVLAEGQTLSGALLLVPGVLPLTETGPVGIDNNLFGATLDTRGANYGADGRILVTATYKIPLAQLGGGGGTEPTVEQTSEADRFDDRTEVEDAPLLTHPVALAFPLVDKNKLQNLIEGDVVPNPAYNGTTNTKEFIFAVDIDDKRKGEECEFSDTDVTANGITASPLDYARLIRAEVTTYKRGASRFQWRCTRSQRPDPSERNRVGDIIESVVLPTAQDDRQWLYAGFNVSHEAPSAFNILRDFVLTERGGAFKEIYKGGAATISPP